MLPIHCSPQLQARADGALRHNPRGLHHEMWYHAAGCRRYFNVTRDTRSYEIVETYPLDAQPGVVTASPAESGVGGGA